EALWAAAVLEPDDEAALDDTIVAPPVGRAPTRRELRALKAAEAAGVASQVPAIHIGDRWSAAFVVITLLVFVVIGLNGLLFGTGGAFNPYVSPTPAPTAAPTATP